MTHTIEVLEECEKVIENDRIFGIPPNLPKAEVAKMRNL
jgi:hypothetical protein